MIFSRVASHFKKFDWVLLGAIFLLVIFGLISIWSSSCAKGDFFNFKKQILFLAIGILLMIFVSFLDILSLKNNPYLILFLYFISIFLLIGLFFVPQIRGVRGWYKVGAFSFDPIEVVKIILVILLAKYFSMRHIEMYRLQHIVLSGIYVFIPSVLIFFQPDLGSVLVLLFLWIAILVISGIKLRQFLLLCFVFIVLGVIGWFFLLQDYQRARISAFLNPRIEPLGAGWSQRQSKIAIGSGGFWGKGITKGSQTQYGFLPEPQTDFIFASIAEETGIVGIGILLTLYLVVVFRIIKIASLARNNFFRLFASGFAAVLVSQIFIHIGMNLGILPIIGIPLPFVSYGGSGLIANFVSLGIIQNIKSRE
ncbi:rod shape-determining protein RodA [bacterium]|nr:rod shape-determining protein RodA [bacterium]